MIYIQDSRVDIDQHPPHFRGVIPDDLDPPFRQRPQRQHKPDQAGKNANRRPDFVISLIQDQQFAIGRQIAHIRHLLDHRHGGDNGIGNDLAG